MRKPAILGVALVVALLTLSLPALTLAQGPLAGQLVCLDPGHGGTDPGAVNDLYGLEEADINLDVAYGLKGLLEYEGASVVMARSDDRHLTNSDRYTFCNAAGATLLISIHTNSVSDATWDGSQTLYFKSADLALAQAVHGAVYEQLLSSAPDLGAFRDFGLRKYASGVLLKSDMPAIMAEPLFMSHPAEAELLVQPIYEQGSLSGGCSSLQCRRGQIAQALRSGIVNYVTSNTGGGGDDGGSTGGGKPCASPPCRK